MTINTSAENSDRLCHNAVRNLRRIYFLYQIGDAVASRKIDAATFEVLRFANDL
jgi:hypothetical protein